MINVEAMTNIIWKTNTKLKSNGMIRWNGVDIHYHAGPHNEIIADFTVNNVSMKSMSQAMFLSLVKGFLDTMLVIKLEAPTRRTMP